MRTLIIDNAVRPKGVDGLAHLIEPAWRADNRQEAVLFVRLFAFLADFHEGARPLAGIVATDLLLPAAKAADGGLILALPVDYLVWTEALSENASRVSIELPVKADSDTVEMWIMGGASPRALRELKALGFTVHQRSFDVSKRVD